MYFEIKRSGFIVDEIISVDCYNANDEIFSFIKMKVDRKREALKCKLYCFCDCCGDPYAVTKWHSINIDESKDECGMVIVSEVGIIMIFRLESDLDTYKVSVNRIGNV